MVARELWHQQTYSVRNSDPSGLPVEVSFLSFDDIIINYVPKIDVIITAGMLIPLFPEGVLKIAALLRL